MPTAKKGEKLLYEGKRERTNSGVCAVDFLLPVKFSQTFIAAERHSQKKVEEG